MKTAVVVPNWNGLDFLERCIESLMAQTYSSTIIIVDNASTDGSIDIIEKKFSEVTIIRNPKNLGFAGGVNSGIKYAISEKFDAIALFNNDAVADKNWLNYLALELNDNPSTGIVTCKLLRSDKSLIDSTGDYYSTWGIPFPRGRNEKAKDAYLESEEVFGASGGASIYRTKMLDEIGLFDERYFAYYEDVDISFRARLAGWEIRYIPKSIAYHDVGGTSSKMGDFTRYHSIKNFLILYTKTMPASLYWKFLPTFLYQFTRTTARSIIDHKFHIWLRSVAVFALLLPGILKDRRIIQSNRKLTPSEVEGLLHIGRPPKIPVLSS